MARTIERAFELARSGNVRSLTELRRVLRSEGCDQVEFHLEGKLIKKQLIALIGSASSSD